MAGYISFIDDPVTGRELTSAGEDVIGKRFARRGEFGSSPYPERAGARTGLWSRPVYRPDSPAVAAISGVIATALFSEQDVEIVCIGDSKTEDTQEHDGEEPVLSWPGILRRAWGGVEGFILAKLAARDGRWNLTNMDRGSDATLDGVATLVAGTPSALTFDYDELHTGGAFWIHCAAGGTVQISVDGGAPQTLTVPAGGGYREITPTISGDAAHTYALTSNATIRVLGFRPVFSGPRLKITNMGRSNSSAPSWAAGISPIGLWDGFRAAIPDADVILCQHGTNGATANGIAPLFAQIVAVTPLAVVIAPGGIAAIPDIKYGGMYLSLWDQADLHRLPLIDNSSIIGDHDEAVARGLMADIVHENRRGHAWEAAAVLKLLAPPVGAGGPN